MRGDHNHSHEHLAEDQLKPATAESCLAVLGLIRRGMFSGERTHVKENWSAQRPAEAWRGRPYLSSAPATVSLAASAAPCGKPSRSPRFFGAGSEGSAALQQQGPYSTVTWFASSAPTRGWNHKGAKRAAHMTSQTHHPEQHRFKPRGYKTFRESLSSVRAPGCGRSSLKSHDGCGCHKLHEPRATITDRK